MLKMLKMRYVIVLSSLLFRRLVISPPLSGFWAAGAHFWATADFVPCCEVLVTPPDGKGHLANMPTCGPLLILCPTLKCWGPLGRQGLCSKCAHLWASANFVPRFEALGTPRTAGVI